MEKINTQSADVITQLTKMAEMKNASIEQLILFYCQERLLNRLSTSSYYDQFYIEGDFLFFTLAEGVGMPPNELTLTAQQSAYQNDLVQQAFAEICSIKIPEDGVQFFENDIESIIMDTSIHLKIPATLGSITTYIELKITFIENRVAPQIITSPSVLDMKPAELYTYPIEYVVAQALLDIYQYPAVTSKVVLDIERVLQTQHIEGRKLQAYLEEMLDQHRLTLEVTPILEKGIVKQFFDPIYEAMVADGEFFKQWNSKEQAWQ
ncbi:nucleotidyl transferase AbiEii/AbiGii toxin family protein [Lysinibacillus sphaericus]|uniref:nucleotidyl transferase AbiEii/AbiGii toxin family protein n=1 Tax=Lysinibacillus sphaericus TaxID=1421 RepID=UPI0025A1A0C6|nr:nucleotidyl transferase AbiEii/AbiGii toxin family protein [Lysinibacillus sphaericus]MDM5350115.1 nucleotidyl transferase AbiEii/AbiGii toxin family protein [Lysinibacillus sphaericus]